MGIASLNPSYGSPDPVEQSVKGGDELDSIGKLLITGGCGFIGTQLISHLMQEHPGARIRVLDNLSVGSRKDLSKVAPFFECRTSIEQGWKYPVHLIVGDITDFEAAGLACTGVDAVVHLAANSGVPASVENPRLDLASNVLGTFNMLEASRLKGVKRFVFASSGAPIGACEPPIHEEIACHPVSPYGASKLAGEGYCSAFYHSFGLETVILRFANVYGPGSRHKSSVVAGFIKRAINGETLEIFGDGKQTRDFIYVDDLVRAICLSLMKDGIGGQTFQIASNREKTVSEMADELLDVLRGAGMNGVGVEKKAPRVGDVNRNYSDTSKARKSLGWDAEVQFRQGLEKTLAWFLNSDRKASV
ncbi:MAG: NAD-dependent epimerase/dehydratase family protein [Desulfobacteraceae bacterium]|nr:MAG: NAD-dependent epimerase/dehydratase family protein [Desulfobacteraceae bacterium]